MENKDIKEVIDAVNDLLQYKNKKYGNSALEPLKIFSNAEPDNGLCVRLDDKLSRIANNTEIQKNDVIDATGYLILLCAQKGWKDFNEFKD